MQVLKEITLDKVINLYGVKSFMTKSSSLNGTIIAALHSMS